MSLSVEIIDHILSFLQDDPEALELCSAVLPEEIVARHLYNNITIPGNSNPGHVIHQFNDPEHLAIRLASNPRIAGYVRNLTISIGDHWAVHRKLPSILSQLSRVESTGLSGRGVVPWLQLNKQFRTVFVDHLKLPTIRMISITGIGNFPLSAFDKCKNLRRLQLVSKFGGGGSVSTSSPCPLEHLEVTPQVSPRRFVSWAKTNTLRSLSLDFHSLRYQGTLSFPDILRGFCHTLVNLELNFRLFFSTDSLVPTLPSLEFPLLQCLVVHTILYFGLGVSDNKTSYSALPVIKELLESMATTTMYL